LDYEVEDANPRERHEKNLEVSSWGRYEDGDETWFGSQ